jgi:hypothetical protein
MLFVLANVNVTHGWKPVRMGQRLQKPGGTPSFGRQPKNLHCKKHRAYLRPAKTDRIT